MNQTPRPGGFLPRSIGPRTLFLLIALNAGMALVLWARHAPPPRERSQPPAQAAIVQPPGPRHSPTRAKARPLSRVPPEVLDACRDRYFEGLREVLAWLSTKERPHLEKAFDAFRSLGAVEMNTFVRYSLMFTAWTQELLGSRESHDRFLREGVFSEIHYQYFFHHMDLAGFIRYQMIMQCQSQCDDLSQAVQAFQARNGGTHPNTLADLVPRDIRAIPPCPFTGQATDYADKGTNEGAASGIAGTVCCMHSRRQSLEAGGSPGPSGTSPQITAQDMPRLEQRFKVGEMILDGYTEAPRLNGHWNDMVRAAGVTPGQTLADVGCGPGLFTLPMARAVAPGGKVFAVDINQSVLDFVAFSAAREPGLVVKTVMTSKDALELPAESVDVMFIIECYHANLDITNPKEEVNFKEHLLPWLRSVLLPLKRGGKLLIGEGNVKPEVILEQVPQAGFEPVPIPEGTVSDSNRRYFTLFRRPK